MCNVIVWTMLDEGPGTNTVNGESTLGIYGDLS